MQLLDPVARDKLEFDIDSAKINPQLYSLVETLLTAFDKTDGHMEKPGSVLIFLPGLFEIEDLYEILKESNEQRQRGSSELNKWKLIPLHSSITVEEQKRAFEPAEKGFRKIIISTNIAESSVTVPDVVYGKLFCILIRAVKVTNNE